MARLARPRPALAPREAALRALLDELEAIAEPLSRAMLDRYLETIPSYRALPDETLRQILEVNRRNIYGFIAALREERGPSDEELSLIRESASRRAREGVPLSALLAAYRSGAQLAWEEVRRLIGDDYARLGAGIDLATAIMHWIDEASGSAAQSYLAEFERLTSDREAARRDFVDGAFSGVLTGDEILARAEALGLDPSVAHAVALVGLETPGEEAAQRNTLHRLRSMIVELPAADHSLAVARATEVVVIFPTAAGGEGAMAARLRPFVEIACDALGAALRAGVGRARASLAELAGSYREASIALTAARAGSSSSVAVYGEVLVEELILRERAVSRRLAQTILEPLSDHEELRQTLMEYISYGPSLPAVAKRMFLHPNTVAYRLAKVRDLTGRDPKTPAGIAELFLALRAAQLVGTDQA